MQEDVKITSVWITAIHPVIGEQAGRIHQSSHVWCVEIEEYQHDTLAIQARQIICIGMLGGGAINENGGRGLRTVQLHQIAPLASGLGAQGLPQVARSQQAAIGIHSMGKVQQI